ncbi:MAG: sugar ABC transporter ATP-binding protein [Methyloligellaceae bacterium]
MPEQNKPVLEAKGITKSFPGVKALKNVDLNLYPGEVHSLLGENGAGKSTLIKCLTGAYHKDGGTILLEGREINPRDTLDSQNMSIGTVYQEVNLMPNLTVAENLYLGREPRTFRIVRASVMNKMAKKLLSEFGLSIDPGALLSRYSIAVQQVIAIARAVDLSGRVLILDEPTASLDKTEVQLLFSVIEKLKQRGIAIVFITHFLDQVYALSDRVTVLRNGERVGSDVIADIPQKKLITMMLGRQLEAETSLKRQESNAGRELLRFEKFGRSGHIDPFSLTIKEGEVIGVAGLLGAGRTETAETIFGIVTADTGSSYLRGNPVKLSSPRDSIRYRFGLCPEDRKTEGIIGDLSVRENIILALQARQGWAKPLSRLKQAKIADHYIKTLDIRLPDKETPIKNLSGGNQQKALLARWLATDPEFLILDEPTRGIDIGAHTEIIQLIEDLRKKGLALLVISSELEELLAYSSRIVVVRDRVHVAELNGQNIVVDDIVQAIAGGQNDKVITNEL